MIPVAVAVCLCALLLAAVWTVERRRSDRCLTCRLRESVIVTLNSGATFSGVLLDADVSTLILTRAVLAAEDVPVDGELLLRWSEVAYVQKP